MGKAQADQTHLEGVTVLEALRPPQGYQVKTAFGTTYSLELPVAVACLIALSGTASDTIDFTLHAALRSFQTLKDRVRIAAQCGRVAAPTSKGPILHILDQILFSAKCDEQRRSFHPKIWLVEWESKSRDLPPRWRLLVGSRNLTSSAAWDFGTSIDGSPTGTGTRFPELAKFLRCVESVCDSGDFLARFNGLEDVRWELPLGATAMHFGFHGAQQQPTPWQETALAKMAHGAQKVLAISPFVDTQGTAAFARFAQVNIVDGKILLLAGSSDLEHLAHSKEGNAALAKLDARQAIAANDQASTTEIKDDTPTPEMREIEIGLHAKAFAAWHSRHEVSLLFGSPNLTRRGWTGENVESWIRLRGKAQLAEPLWDWAGRFPVFRPISEEATEPTILERLEKVLEQIRCDLANSDLMLREASTDAATLTSSLAISEPEGTQLLLRVARLSDSEPFGIWPLGEDTLKMPSCSKQARTRLVQFRASVTQGGEAAHSSWVQEVRLEPPLDCEARDSLAIADALGPSGFLAYLRGLVDPGVDDGEEAVEGGRCEARDATWTSDEPVSLEWLLRAFSRQSANEMEPLRSRLRTAISGYRSALAGKTDSELDELWLAWDAFDAALPPGEART